MTKKAKFSISVAITLLIFSCDTPVSRTNTLQLTKSDTIARKETAFQYNAIKFVDSFINVNNDAIKKNTALKERHESLCTKQMLPLIDKKGLYDDLPFKLIATTTHEGIAYGNFIYEDDIHFVKVTCIIKEDQLQKLQENSLYLIKFKTAKFQDGVSFENEFSKIELPTVSAYLIRFTPL